MSINHECPEKCPHAIGHNSYIRVGSTMARTMERVGADIDECESVMGYTLLHGATGDILADHCEECGKDSEDLRDGLCDHCTALLLEDFAYQVNCVR
jgi:hypothetical protein